MADSYARIDSEDNLIINTDQSRRSCCCHPRLTVFLITLSLIILGLRKQFTLFYYFLFSTFYFLGHGLVIYFVYFKVTEVAPVLPTILCNMTVNCMSLKVIALNTWGMPAVFGSEYKDQRMKAIGDVVAKGDFDLFLLEELWMQPDHETIASQVPAGYSITGAYIPNFVIVPS